MKATDFYSSADQARELGLKLGDTIQGRQEVGDGWVESRITLLWLGMTQTVWIVSGRTHLSRFEGGWSCPHESVSWDLHTRDWERIKTPPEHAAYLATLGEAGQP
jgi:hypothetical protein